MIVLWAGLGIALALVIDLGLGRFVPEATRYVDVMSLPLIAYALRTSQRSSMVVGCVSGLVQDYWLEPRLFGIDGLVKTVLGWALGGIGARFDLNNTWGRFAAGASVHLLDETLQGGIRRLFGETVAPLDPLALGIRAIVGGVLVAAVLTVVHRLGSRRSAASPPRRKA